MLDGCPLGDEPHVAAKLALEVAAMPVPEPTYRYGGSGGGEVWGIGGVEADVGDLRPRWEYFRLLVALWRREMVWQLARERVFGQDVIELAWVCLAHDLAFMRQVYSRRLLSPAQARLHRPGVVVPPPIG